MQPTAQAVGRKQENPAPEERKKRRVIVQLKKQQIEKRFVSGIASEVAEKLWFWVAQSLQRCVKAFCLEYAL
jgi:hypothetical protein